MMDQPILTGSFMDMKINTTILTDILFQEVVTLGDIIQRKDLVEQGDIVKCLTLRDVGSTLAIAAGKK